MNWNDVCPNRWPAWDTDAYCTPGDNGPFLGPCVMDRCEQEYCDRCHADFGAWRVHGGALARHYAEMLGLGFPESLVCLMVGYDARYILDAVGWSP